MNPSSGHQHMEAGFNSERYRPSRIQQQFSRNVYAVLPKTACTMREVMNAEKLLSGHDLSISLAVNRNKQSFLPLHAHSHANGNESVQSIHKSSTSFASSPSMSIPLYPNAFEGREFIESLQIHAKNHAHAFRHKYKLEIESNSNMVKSSTITDAYAFASISENMDKAFLMETHDANSKNGCIDASSSNTPTYPKSSVISSHSLQLPRRKLQQKTQHANKHQLMGNSEAYKKTSIDGSSDTNNENVVDIHEPISSEQKYIALQVAKLSSNKLRKDSEFMHYEEDESWSTAQKCRRMQEQSLYGFDRNQIITQNRGGHVPRVGSSSNVTGSNDDNSNANLQSDIDITPIIQQVNFIDELEAALDADYFSFVSKFQPKYWPQEPLR
jgi:hypothetical protein